MSAPAQGGQGSSGMVTVIPDDLKKLARYVVRGFYAREDVLIIDMLVRHHCLREDDLSMLLKFDKKMVRAQMAGLKRDKLIQEKQRMETRSDDPTKFEKMNCYFINYKIFVNIVKYKLDHMRKKMEMSERDATSRASFKCSNCQKNFTDLEVNDLFDPFSGEMRCTFCRSPVDEDDDAGPQSDSRQVLATFNEQMKPLYDKLVLVENIKLDPSVLEPEPAEIGQKASGDKKGPKGPTEPGGKWSGEATRGTGLRPEEQDIKINFGEEASKKDANVPKDVPIWITQSTVTGAENLQHNPRNPGHGAADAVMEDDDDSTMKDDDEITMLLLQHEKKNSSARAVKNLVDNSDSDKSDDSDMEESFGAKAAATAPAKKSDEMSSDDDADDGIPTVRVGSEEIAVTDVNEDTINRMTAEEKERYTQIFQDFYAHMYD